MFARCAHGAYMSEPKLSPHEVRQVAVAAACDPRSVQAVLEGRPVRGSVHGRIVAALKKLGHGHLVPAKAPGA
jgi:hypothetical protein